jgi:formylglycine-generating enzyme required for sulfatase activity
MRKRMIFLLALAFWSQGPAEAQARSFADCRGCPQMVAIPAGSFEMGSPASETNRDALEGPQHRVDVRPFAASKYDITRGEFAAFVAATQRYIPGGCQWSGGPPGWSNPAVSWRKLAFVQDDRHPVVCVTWHDARDYAVWLSKKTGKRYRLLTEAEWEFADRAHSSSAFPWGPEATRDKANFGALKCCSGFAEGKDRWVNTSPVGSFPSNAFGLYDMNGNVLQYLQDCFSASYDGVPKDGSSNEKDVELKLSGDLADMTGTRSCAYRMIRGGDWGDPPAWIRAAARNFAPAPQPGVTLENYRSSGVGFRVARSMP